MHNDFINITDNGVIIAVKLVPNSSFNKIVDYCNEFIRIKISAPPIENKANKEFIDFLSDCFKINRSKIKIVSGDKSKLKKIFISNVDTNDVIQKIMFVLNSIQKEK